ncbi:AtpZ/AtpI family protein [Desulfobulbus oligotrophicus]|uniref:AtpZ/AtpI family protein n=1 Tax=Desulfobulbus oligotrophicus TaxID=1909699 RepID=A0A7T5VBJ6_9BACT|nr:AtpZ/AtpI family protein [Desulfobulbus oligotrophicus]QQG64855.1 AtpZ/AtpI family protein [Desulfobulbus oligotrophicus]
MPERDPIPPNEPLRGLDEEIGAREARKVRMRSRRDRTLWHGLGAAGIVGWSVTVPTVAGTFLGLWIDRRWPGDLSWTLALLLGGVALGCLNAWYWVNQESRMIEKDEAEQEADQ